MKRSNCMKKFGGFIVLLLVSMQAFAQFKPEDIQQRYLDNLPLSEFNQWGGNRTTCSLELRSAIAAFTNDRFDIADFFLITEIYGNESIEDDQFWEYVLNNYETIIKAKLSPGDVNIFFVPIRYFEADNTTVGYFLVSRYNGGNKNDPNSFRLFLYAYGVQWLE